MTITQDMRAQDPSVLAAPVSQMVDFLRLVAAITIVFFHAKAAGSDAMSAAMGVFACLLGYFAFLSLESGKTPRDFVAVRYRRLLRPFFIWFAIYAALRAGDAWTDGEDQIQTLLAWLPPQGTMHQLWFLPWAFVVCGVIALAHGRMRRLGVLPALVCATLLAVLCALLVALIDMPPGIAVLVNFLPSVALGLVLARSRTAGTRLAIAAFAALLGLSAWPMVGHLAMQLVIGVPLCALALSLPRAGSLPRAMGGYRGFAQMAMLIYLLHTGAIATLLNLFPGLLAPAELAVAATLLSAAVGLVLLRSPLHRVLV